MLTLTRTPSWMALVVSLVILVAGTGCPPGVGLPLGGAVVGIDATDAVVGATGRVRIDLVNPATSDTTVTLSSSNSAVAAVPAAATLVEGADTVEVSYNAGAVGQALITVRIGGSSQSTFVNVVSSLQLSSVSGPFQPIQTGADSSLFVGLNMTTPVATDVSLTSSDPAVVAAPSSVTVSEFDSGVEFSITGGTAGAATITARLGDVMRTTVVHVVDSFAIDDLFISFGSRLQTGVQTTLFISVDAIVADDTRIELTSTDSNVALLEESATIPADDSSTAVPLIAQNPGSTTITARLGDQARSVVLFVVDTPAIDSLNFSSFSDKLILGFPETLQIGLNAVPAGFTTIDLTTSNAGVLDLPPSVVVRPGSTFAQVPVTLASTGAATVTAHLGASQLSRSVSVDAGPEISFVSLTDRVVVGQAFDLTVFLDADVPTDTAVTLSSSNAAALSVPPSVVIVGGEDSAVVTLTGASPGTALITVEVGGSTRSEMVTVVAAPSLDFLSINNRLQVGATTTLSVFLDVAPAGPADILLTSSNPAVMSVPAVLALADGDSGESLSVTAAGVGTAIITAQFGASMLSTAVIVVDTPIVDFVSVNSRLQVGVAVSLSMGLNASVAADTPVTITNSNPSVISGPTATTIQAGESFASMTIVALAEGSANLTFEALGSSQGVTIVVVATPVINSIFASAPKVGAIGTLNISLDAIVANETTITLTNSNPAAVSVPSEAVIPAGDQSVSVSITGLSAAMSTITATLGASMQMTNVTVLP